MELSLSLQDKVALDIHTPPPTSTESTAPATPVELITSRPPVNYRSTAVQTRPPHDASTFVRIYGRGPTHQELERKVGLAAIGRYKSPTDSLHGVVYGNVFQREPNEHEAATTASGFQTLDPGLSQKALTKAKVKAVMSAKKYQHIASEAGFKIWGESKDENVVHTQQFPFSIQLDANGVAQTDEDLTRCFIPNIYKEDIEPEIKPQHTIRAPASHAMNKMLPSAMPLHCTNPYPALLQSSMTCDTQPPRPIPALEPSTPQDYDDIRVSGIYYDRADMEDVTGAYATDPDAFVVYDASKNRRRSSARAELPPRESKRIKKDNPHIEDEGEAPRRKRTRTSSLHSQAARPQDRHHVRAKHSEEYTRSREHSPSHRSKTNKDTLSYKHEDRRTPDRQDASLRHSRREDSHRSRCRSRSRDCRESDKSRRSSVSRDRDNTRRARRRLRSPVRSEEEADTKPRIEQTHSSKKHSAARKEVLDNSHQEPRSARTARARDSQTQHDSPPNVEAGELAASTQPLTSSSTHTKPHGSNMIEAPAGSKDCQNMPMKVGSQDDKSAYGTSHETPLPRQRIQREELKRSTPRMQQDRSNSRTQLGSSKAETEPICQRQDSREVFQKTVMTDSGKSRNGHKRSLDESDTLSSIEDPRQPKKAKQGHDVLEQTSDRQTYATKSITKADLNNEGTKHRSKEINVHITSANHQKEHTTSIVSSTMADPLKDTKEKKLQHTAKVDSQKDIKKAGQQMTAEVINSKKDNKIVEQQQGVKVPPQQDTKKPELQQDIKKAEHQQATKKVVPQEESMVVKQNTNFNEEDKRKRDVKAKIAERRANRAPRAEMGVYVPRTMRSQQEAGGRAEQGNNANSSRNNRPENGGRGRRR
jgi:hypothetical protein